MKQYFCNNELDFTGLPEWEAILALHQVSKDDAAPYSIAIEFDSNGASIGAFILGDEVPDDSPWAKKISQKVAAGSLTPLRTPPNTLWFSTSDANGVNRLGGPTPDGLRLPDGGFASGYGYVGSLSAQDPAFPLLRKDVHLIWPFFLDYHAPLFLDVSDPLQPTIIDSATCEMFDAASGAPTPASSEDLGPATIESDIIADLFHEQAAHPVFELSPFSMTKGRTIDDDKVKAGAPAWIQYPEVPLDPETNQPMHFLCQIDGGPKLTDVSARPEEGSYLESMFERMNFWEGVLFVFVSLDGQRLCLIAQNS